MAVSAPPSPGVAIDDGVIEEARRRQRRRRLGIAVVLAAAALIVAGLSSLLDGGGGGFARARAQLERAARAAAAGTLAPKLRPGLAWFKQDAQTYQSPAIQSVPSTAEFRTWFAGPGGAGDWQGPVRGKGGNVTGIGGVVKGAPGFGDWDPGSLQGARIRSTASALRTLGASGSGYWGYNRPSSDVPVSDGDTSAFTKLAVAADLLGDAPLLPSARAAVFRAIATLPGLRYLGPAHDPIGRPGLAVAITGSPRALNVPGRQRYRIEVIFDPSTGRVLGFRTIAIAPLPAAHVRAGALMFAWAYERAAMVPAAELPALVCAGASSPTYCKTLVRWSISRPRTGHRSFPLPPNRKATDAHLTGTVQGPAT